MGRIFKEYLSGNRVYSCSTCKAHLALHEDIISKVPTPLAWLLCARVLMTCAQSFQGRHGRAYLFNKCVNVSIGPREERALITGLHVVADIYCIECQSLLGWKYVRSPRSFSSPSLTLNQEEAYEESQKYKVGKFILEKAKMTKEDGTWED